MIQPTYRKDHVLVWIGFLTAVLFRVLEVFGAPSENTPALIPFLTQFVVPFNLLYILGDIAVFVILYGCYLVLKSKSRALWWLLILIPGLFGGPGIILVPILFWLKDKSEPMSAPVPLQPPPVQPPAQAS